MNLLFRLGNAALQWGVVFGRIAADDRNQYYAINVINYLQMLKIDNTIGCFQWTVSLNTGFNNNICSKKSVVAFSTETISADLIGDAIT
jgi:hypothetical protein